MENIEYVLPGEIEKRSFAIIGEELKERGIVLPPEQEPVTKRVIHTSADFDYAENLVFSEGAVEHAMDAIRRGTPIVTDTQMGKAGINKRKLAEFGSEVYCFMSDEDVAAAAKANGTTRAAASMDKAAALGRDVIFAVGNAPVGFVNVVQSKELILSLKETQSIVARGRKGGSNIAACICNALLYQM